DEPDGASIGGRLGEELRASRAACTSAIVDQYRPACRFTYAWIHRPRSEIDRAAGRETDDETDRLGLDGLTQSRLGDSCRHDCCSQLPMTPETSCLHRVTSSRS